MIQPRDFSRSWVMYPVVSSPFSSVCPATVARFLSLSLCLSLRSWRPRGWRPSAVPTETRRRSSRSPSSPSCSGRWVWVARLWASRSLCCSFCRNTKDTDDWDSILCPGQRPPPGSSSSSVYVTYWDAQVKKGWPTFFFCFLPLQGEEATWSLAGASYARKYAPCLSKHRGDMLYSCEKLSFTDAHAVFFFQQQCALVGYYKQKPLEGKQEIR